MAGMALLVMGILSFVLWVTWKDEKRSQGLAHFIDRLCSGRTYITLVVALVVLGIIGIYFFLLMHKMTDMHLLAYFVRLAPFVLWLTLTSFQTPLFQRIWKLGFQFPLATERSAIIATGITLVATLFAAWLIMVTRVGLTRDKFVGLAWGDPGTPLLPLQVLLAFLSGLIVYVLIKRWERRQWLDVLLFALVWGVAAWVWINEPVHFNFFEPQPRYPNYQLYPYSDASEYDADGYYILLGKGFGPIVPSRPWYSLFLAGIHAVAGSDYERLLDLQSLILALFPAILYLLVSRIHHRMTGFVVAILVILREQNSIALSNIANVSHSKMLMSDLPTALWIAGMVLLLVLWLRNKPGIGWQKTYPLLAGGVLGATVLIRVQALVLIAPVLFAIWLALRGRSRWVNSLLFLLGVTLAVFPWLCRNKLATGQFAFDSSSRIWDLAYRYTASEDYQMSSEEAGGSEEGFFGNMFGRVVGETITNPASVLGFLGEHFSHNLVSMALVPPVSYTLTNNILEFYNKSSWWRAAGEPLTKLWKQCCSLIPFVTEDVPYWPGWNGTIKPESRLPILVTLVLISVGIGACWKQSRIAGILPLLVGLGYSLSCALIRSSGWRFILPVDWVSIVYYSAGIVQLTFWAWSFFQGRLYSKEDTAIVEKSHRLSSITWGLTLCAVILPGALLWLADSLIPRNYPTRQDVPVILSEKMEAWGLERASVEAFLAEGGVLFGGVGLYPEHFQAGENVPWFGWSPAVGNRKVSQLGFYLAGDNNASVTLSRNTQDYTYPNMSPILVLGCQGQYSIEALAVGFLDTNTVLYRELFSGWSCP